MKYVNDVVEEKNTEQDEETVSRWRAQDVVSAIFRGDRIQGPRIFVSLFLSSLGAGDAAGGLEATDWVVVVGVVVVDRCRVA